MPLKPNTTRINTRNVPVPVRDMFKAQCARLGITMEIGMIILMKRAIQDDKDKLKLREGRK